MHDARNLILIGPMGAGKTTLGKALAEHLGLAFVDLDHEIEARTGASIPLIFDMEGEEGFRQRESAALADVLHRDGILLATGGGAILREGNRRLLRERGFVLWLDTPVAVQLERLSREHAKRPLLRDANRREKLETLAEQRNPLYAETAHLAIPSVGRHHGPAVIRQMADNVLRHWRRDAFTSLTP